MARRNISRRRADVEKNNRKHNERLKKAKL